MKLFKIASAIDILMAKTDYQLDRLYKPPKPSLCVYSSIAI